MELENLVKQNAEILQLLAQKELTKNAAGAPTNTLLHGLGGIWSGAGIERDVVSAHIRPLGFGQHLRRMPSVYEDPRFSTLTGYTAVTGTRPTTSCADAQTGYVKSCELTAYFGLNRMDTQEIEMDKVMLRANRGDHVDLRLRGEVLGLSGFTPSGLNQQQILNIVTMSEMVVAAVGIERQLNIDLWQGTVAGGSFPGLDAQIVTGQVDARTGTACPAVDADVKNFGYADVCGSTLDIVEYLSAMAWYLQWIAQQTGLEPVEWVIVMRPELWFELSGCYPCSFLSNRCKDDTGAQIAVMNDSTNVDMRDAMRAGMYIPINGRNYPVFVDTGIYEANNINNANCAAGEYASSIYFVPLTIQGNFPVTYMEYLNYSEASGDRALLQGKEDWWWTDNGFYSWSITQYKWCYTLHLKAEPRVILRTPQLSGKIQNVKYSPLQHLRSDDPSSAYFMDGGVSMLTSGTRYAPWFPSGSVTGR